MTPLKSDTNGKYVTDVDVTNGMITIYYGNEANSQIKADTLGLTPYESPDLSVIWRCGDALVPAGARDPIGTKAGGATAPDAAGSLVPNETQYLPSACRQ